MFPTTLPQTAPLAINAETNIVAEYMVEKLQEMAMNPKQCIPDAILPHPHHWSIDFAMEVDLALDVITHAFGNQGK